jgi:hypothetical protein
MRANLALMLPAAAVIRSGGEAGGGRGLGPMTALLLKRAPASRTRPSGENRTSSSTLLLDRTWNEISIHHYFRFSTRWAAPIPESQSTIS